MELIIDNREHELIRVLDERNITHSVEMLELGDIVIRGGDGKIVFVIERKTIADLKASICDGRSREQKARLMNCGIDTKRIMYLVEGGLSKRLNENISGMSVSTLLGSIINTQLRDGIMVHRTMSVSETATFIERLYQKLLENTEKYFTNTCSSGTDVGYASTLKTKKNANITPNVWFIQQLSLVPQVTEKTAKVILEKYPTVRSLILAYENTEEEKRPELLSDLTYPIANGKIRRIGSKVSDKIFKIFYGLC
jgi:ERCC4-type nuclease